MNLVERVRQRAFCTDVAQADSVACNTQLALLTINSALSVVLLFALVMSAWLALRLSEKIQEEEEEAASAEKERVKNVMAVMHSRSKSMARRNSKFQATG